MFHPITINCVVLFKINFSDILILNYNYYPTILIPPLVIFQVMFVYIHFVGFIFASV